MLSHWKKTDMRDYKVTKILSRLDDSGNMFSDTSSYTFKFVIVDSTINGYRIKWQFEDTPLADDLTEDEYQDLSTQLGNLRLIYTTDKWGVFKHIENWDEVSKYFTSYYNIRYADEPEKDSTAVIDEYKRKKNAITTQQGVETALFGELTLFHKIYGYKSAVGDTVRHNVQGQLEPTFQDALEHFKYYMDLPNEQTKEGIVKLKGEIDSTEAHQKLQSLIKKYIGSMPENNQQERKDKSDAIKALSEIHYENTDEVIWRFNYKIGFPTKIDMKHVLDFDDKIERYKTIKEIIIESL